MTTTLYLLDKANSLKCNKQSKFTTLTALILKLYSYISDMIYHIDNCDIASYANDKTPYTSDFNLEEVSQKLELITSNLFEWVKNKHMKANADKCYLLVARDTDAIAKIGELGVKNSREKNFLVLKYIPGFISETMFLPFSKRQAKSYRNSQES